MSNFETQNALTVQDHYQPPAVDSFDYDEPESSPIRGARVRFDNGAYFTGKEKRALDTTDRKFIVLDKAAGYQFLKQGCQPEWLMQIPGQPKPERPHVDEAEWPKGLNGEAEHPHRWTQWVYLMDVDSGETITFESNTHGGKSAIDELTAQIKSMRTLQPGAMPIIQLGSVMMPTNWGKRPRPSWRVVSWRNRAVAEEPPPQLEAPEYDNSREYEDVEF